MYDKICIVVKFYEMILGSWDCNNAVTKRRDWPERTQKIENWPSNVRLPLIGESYEGATIRKIDWIPDSDSSTMNIVISAEVE